MSSMDLALQEAMERFLAFERDEDAGLFAQAERYMELFSHYLLHFSDLFQEERAESEEYQAADWEESLDEYMERLFDGDMEGTEDLGNLKLSQVDPEHLRDFIGWFLLREPGMDSVGVQACAGVLREWLAFLAERCWLDRQRHMEFVSVLNEMESEAVRTVKVARLLLHFVRMGSGLSPRLRARRFSRFVEGHARIEKLGKGHLWLQFDNHERPIGPVPLPESILCHLQPGDVLDVELGLRGEIWQIVDIGPVYPRDVYVEAEEFEVPEKLM